MREEKVPNVILCDLFWDGLKIVESESVFLILHHGPCNAANDIDSEAVKYIVDQASFLVLLMLDPD